MENSRLSKVVAAIVVIASAIIAALLGLPPKPPGNVSPGPGPGVSMNENDNGG